MKTLTLASLALALALTGCASSQPYASAYRPSSSPLYAAHQLPLGSPVYISPTAAATCVTVEDFKLVTSWFKIYSNQEIAQRIDQTSCVLMSEGLRQRFSNCALTGKDSLFAQTTCSLSGRPITTWWLVSSVRPY